jgi:hypothetical protein
MEKIKVFSEVDILDLEKSVHAWIQASYSSIEIIERHFSSCAVGGIDERIVYYNYLIVYREKER